MPYIYPAQQGKACIFSLTSSGKAVSINAQKINHKFLRLVFLIDSWPFSVFSSVLVVESLLINAYLSSS